MSVLERLGMKQLSVWAVAFSLAISLIYSWFYLASSFGFSFFVLSNRGMVEHNVIFSIFSGSLDIAIWVVAVFVVLAFIFYNLASNIICKYYQLLWSVGLFGVWSGLVVWVYLVILGLVSLVSLVLISGLLLGLCLVFSVAFFGFVRRGLFLRILFSGLLVGLFFEFASFVFFSVPSALGLAAGGLGLHWGTVELSFANLSYPVLSYFYLLFVLFGVGAFVFRVLPPKWSWLFAKLRVGGIVDGLRGVIGIDMGEFEFLRGRLVIVLALLSSSVVSCLFVLFTVLPWNNPTGMLVSVDSPVYLSWINHMRSVDVNSALSFAIANDRGLFLVLCYAVSAIIPAVDLIQFVAALLIMLLGVVSLFVLRLFCKDKTVWVFGVLLVPFSFQSLGLIYSGYFANMLALILIFVYLILFFKVLRSWSSLGFFALLGVSVLVLFSHSWTWIIFALSLCMFLFIQWRLTINDKGLWNRFKMQVIFIGATVGVGLLSDLARKMLSPVSSTLSVIATAQSSLGLPNPVYLLSGMQHAVDFDLGGVFANGLLVLLSVVGFIVLLRFKSEVSNFFIAWIFVSCISILFASNDFVFNRFLFMFPWVVLLALGLFWCVGFVAGQLGGFRGWRFWVLVVLLVFVFLMLLNGALRFLFNINAW
jgi:hypothetical protein